MSIYIQEKVKVFPVFRNKPETILAFRWGCSDGTLSIYLSKKYSIKPGYFCENSQICITPPSASQLLKRHLSNVNTEILRVRNTLIDILLEYQRKGVKPSKAELKAEVNIKLNRKQKVIQQRKLLSEYLAEFIQKQRIRNSSKATYNAIPTIVKEYEAQHSSTMYLDSVNELFYEDFHTFLATRIHHKGTGMKPNSIANIFKLINSAMVAAEKSGLTDFKVVEEQRKKLRQTPAESIYLNEYDLEKMQRVKLASPKAVLCLNLFLFTCYTGLRFSDLEALKGRQFKKGQKVFSVHTQKTNTMVIIPISAKAMAIIELFGMIFPASPSLSIYNEEVKRIAKIAGVNDRIYINSIQNGEVKKQSFFKWQLVSSHTGRRTFATNAYLSGIPAIAIMKITGHKSERAFMSYIRIGNEENAEQLLSYAFFS